MNKILALPMELYHNRKLIFSLAKNDFKTKYAGLLSGYCMGIYPARCYDPCVLVCFFSRL